MYVIQLNGEVVSYRDVKLQNTNKIMSFQDFAIISTSIYNKQVTA